MNGAGHGAPAGTVLREVIPARRRARWCGSRERQAEHMTGALLGRAANGRVPGSHS
ncbi:hypothetical protein HOK021_30440 [Streptomyces hygroscopicus]|nr:hypothetical protein HOK021_30440 [Streptomyces hygroscopicus]